MLNNIKLFKYLSDLDYIVFLLYLNLILIINQISVLELLLLLNCLNIQNFVRTQVNCGIKRLDYPLWMLL
jgi:hypothetical protein